MSKPLVFCKTTYKHKELDVDIDTWEIFNIGGDSPVAHGMWNPIKQELAIQYQFEKENLVDYPVREKNGKVSIQERKLHQYFIVVMKDHDAIEYLLKTFVGNFTNQDWKIKYETPSVTMQAATAEEFENADLTQKIEA